MKDTSHMRLRTLGAVCASCAAAAPSPALAADAAPPPSAALTAPLVDPATAPAVHAAVMRRLINRHVETKRRHVRLLGERLPRSERRDLRARLSTLSPARLRARTQALRREIRSLRKRLTHRYGGAPDIPIPEALAAIAQCESHGNPRAVSASGTYRGKYQFSFHTWGTVGGEGDPAQASETEQDRRAAMLYRRDGLGQWPVCGR
jgi:soluble lytic murein transglycosylase-like protein